MAELANIVGHIKNAIDTSSMKTIKLRQVILRPQLLPKLRVQHFKWIADAEAQDQARLEALLESTVDRQDSRSIDSKTYYSI